jgi:hypothetical protein
MEDPQLLSMHFIDESLLVCILSNKEVRVLYTPMFHKGEFVKNLWSEDARCKVGAYGLPL